MSRSEFRWNKKRKHYAYLFKDYGDYRMNLLLHSDESLSKCQTLQDMKTFLQKHTALFRHPNPNKSILKTYYVENRVYCDLKSSFEHRVYNWNWHQNDKRKIKRLKKGRRTR